MANDAPSSITLWGLGPIPEELFSVEELAYLKTLPREVPPVEWLWHEMDRVWRACSLDNRLSLLNQPIGQFYGHPVWLVNGFFSQVDPISAVHRSALANYLSNRGYRRVADFGGGFGELAVRIAMEDPSLMVTIVEPYPTLYGKFRIAQNSQLGYANELDGVYDAVIAQDVLEHVEDPIALAYTLANSVRVGGELIFANCFYPVIECHLPKTFHLRHTFAWHMRAMGLKYMGHVQGFPHIQIFQRGDIELKLVYARFVEKISRFLGPLINMVRS